MEVFVRSDLYEAGRTEDGEAYIGEVFIIVAELEDGSRYEHGHAFPGVGNDFDDIREAAEARAEALAAKIVERGDIDVSYWGALEPRYGSPAYQRAVAAMTPEQLRA